MVGDGNEREGVSKDELKQSEVKNGRRGKAMRSGKVRGERADVFVYVKDARVRALMQSRSKVAPRNAGG